MNSIRRAASSAGCWSVASCLLGVCCQARRYSDCCATLIMLWSSLCIYINIYYTVILILLEYTRLITYTKILPEPGTFLSQGTPVCVLPLARKYIWVTSL